MQVVSIDVKYAVWSHEPARSQDTLTREPQNSV